MEEQHIYQFDSGHIQTWCCGFIQYLPARFTCVASSEKEARKKIRESLRITGIVLGEPIIDPHKK